MARVKICPSCETENSSDKNICACGEPLASVPIKDTSVDTSESTPAVTVCQHQNRKGNYCVDCRAFVAETETVGVSGKWALRFPWGEAAVDDLLWIGRISPASDELIANIEESFPNVSRNHALISVVDQNLFVRDLSSTNGTFVNGEKIPSMQAVELKSGSILRFAKDLEVEALLKGNE